MFTKLLYKRVYKVYIVTKYLMIIFCSFLRYLSIRYFTAVLFILWLHYLQILLILTSSNLYYCNFQSFILVRAIKYFTTTIAAAGVLRRLIFNMGGTSQKKRALLMLVIYSKPFTRFPRRSKKQLNTALIKKQWGFKELQPWG